jgi:DNA-binding XRE family transcriptional regulator
MGTGARIKQVRQEVGMTQRGFGKEIGVSNNYISEIEAEKKVPSLPVLLSIQCIFGIKKEWLLHGKGGKYIKEKFPFTDKEVKIIKSFREMPAENKNIFLELIEKLQKK